MSVGLIVYNVHGYLGNVILQFADQGLIFVDKLLILQKRVVFLEELFSL